MSENGDAPRPMPTTPAEIGAWLAGGMSIADEDRAAVAAICVTEAAKLADTIAHAQQQMELLQGLARALGSSQ